jgi:hypothetical protein
MSYCKYKLVRTNLHRDRDVQSKLNNVQRDKMCTKAGQMYENTERVTKQSGKKYTTPNIYTSAQNRCTVERDRGRVAAYMAER